MHEPVRWYEAIDRIRPYVVKVSTPRGSGTGFLFAYTADGAICAIATASHVIAHEHAWELPIRIEHFASGQSRMLRPKKRAVIVNPSMDTAAIVIAKGNLPFPAEVLNLSPEGRSLKVGFEVGWVGFPALSADNLCLFSGRISCFLEDVGAYLVDGVAINGVSGGPTFHLSEAGGMVLIGVVSAYIPNLATGETLPGVCMIRDVVQLHGVIQTFQNMEEAKEKETPPSEADPSPDPQADEKGNGT